MRCSSFLFAAATPLLLLACTSVSQDSGSATKVSFTKEIKPIFKERCVMCHNAETLPGQLSFESAAGAFIDDKQGRPYIVPGKPHESRLYTNIIAPEFYDLAMPPVSHRLTKKQTETIRLWIEEGADWPSGEEGKIVAEDKVLE